ncbi:MAG: phosphodiester glycosidase family protein [Clostridiales bacterium]|nr:phosphodiester glycosidase family protein [Clostridiales bacterium]
MMKSLIRLLSAIIVFSLLLPAALAEEPEIPAADTTTETAVYKLPIDLTPGMKPNPKGYTGKWEYQDPTISVKIEEGVMPTTEGTNRCSYWVATIKLSDASQLRTMAAGGFDSNRVTKGTTLAKRANAVLAINGDYFCYTCKGYIVRQGEEYLNLLDGDRDVLLIDENGDFHPVVKAKAGDIPADIDGKKIVNAFYFGPLLVENGEAVKMIYGADMAHDTGRQRMAICQVGPLEYKAICCAGPARGSSGLTLRQFANLCAEQGVQTAYNLDGGDSTMMIFKGEKINDVYNMSVRDIADIVYFASAWEGEQ